MRLAVVRNRLAPVDERGAVDVAAVSREKSPSGPPTAYQQRAQSSAWHAAGSETITTFTAA